MKIDFSKMPSQIGIVGSRSFSDDKRINEKMYEIVRTFVFKLPADCGVVSGGARGIDRYAADAAKLNGRRLKEYLPKKDSGIGGLFARNTEIVQHLYKYEGVLVAFLDVDSHRGTDDTMRKAVKMGVPIIKYSFTLNPLACVDIDIPEQYVL